MDDRRASVAAVEAMQRFVDMVPGARAVLAEHVNDVDEILPHLLMADLSRWLVDAVVTGDERGVADFLTAVEVLYTSDDPDTRNVVEVSFMQLLVVNPDGGERTAIEAIRRLAGPAAIADLAREESRWPDPSGNR